MKNNSELIIYTTEDVKQKIEILFEKYRIVQVRLYSSEFDKYLIYLEVNLE